MEDEAIYRKGLVMGYLDRSGEYYEGDKQFGDMDYPDRPSPMHRPEAGGWVLDLNMVVTNVRAERDRLLRDAQFKIAPLQDAVDLGGASEAEAVLLRQWKLYRVDLIRLEQQAGFPLTVKWPPAPQ